MIGVVLAAALAMPSYADGIQDPPRRFATDHGAVRVYFYPPAEVEKLCDHIPHAGRKIIACYWAAARVVIMPNPWQCGSDTRCAALWRHETAHALSGWQHEAQ